MSGVSERVSDQTMLNQVQITGLLGPSRTEEAKAISRLLGSLPPNKRLLQISGSATGSELSDKTLYPNFFRVIPSDSTQVKVGFEFALYPLFLLY